MNTPDHIDYSDDYKLYRCPICNNFDDKEIFRKDRYVYSICRTCSYVYQAIRQKRPHYEHLPYCTQPNYEEHSKNRAEYILKFCKNHVERNNRISILDIGCARGGVMKYIKEKLPESSIMGYTLDMNEHQIDPTLRIAYQNIEDISEYPNNHYDFIVMSHVVEHLYNPVKAMKNVRSLMYYDSFVYIEVPSFDLGEIRSKSIFSPEHISFFTKNSLTNLLSISGLKVIKMEENKYWGNIKAVAIKSYTHLPPPYKKMDYRYSLLKKSALKLLYPFFRLNKKSKNND